MRLIRAVAEGEADGSINRLARRLEIPPSTCFRIIKTLEAGKWVRRRPGDAGYELAAGLTGLADPSGAARRMLLRCEPPLRQLAANTELTVKLSMRVGDRYVEQIDDLAGLSRTNPAMAFVLAMIMFSLAGIPPLAGFFAKFYVFYAAVNAGLAPLAVIGLVLSVIGAFYYLRIVKIIFFDEPKVEFAPMTFAAKTVLTIAGGFTILYVLYPAPLGVAASAAAQSLF